MADIRNYNSNSLISGTSENDYIGNYNSNVTLSGGNGDDTVWNASFNISISGGAGNDSINNEGSEYVTINGGKGDDTILNSSQNNLIIYRAGDGNDIIQGFRADSTLKIFDSSYSVKNNGYDIIVTVGKGKITLTGAASLSQVNIEGKEKYNPSDAKIIKLTAGNDTYKNFIEGVTIQAFGGNDSIYNSSPNVSINVGDGGDSVRNESSSVTIIGETGNDKIENAYGGKNSSINCGAGDDTVWNGGSSNVTINCGAGNDSAEVYGENISISGGAGNDKISLNDDTTYSTGITVNGGKGDDTIYDKDYYDCRDLLVEYTEGDGNDIIYNFKGKDTLSIVGSSYSTQISGNDVVVTVGKGKITLVGAAILDTVNIKLSEETIKVTSGNKSSNSKLITGTNGADEIENSISGATIKALGGNDYIFNYGASVSIEGGAGDDTIENGFGWTKGGSQVTIDGGAGNDYIDNSGASVSINAGAGDDYIYNSSDASLTAIDGGDGDDTIENSTYSDNSSISGGAGNDSISNRSCGVTIDGGVGNDSIKNWVSSVKIDGGEGADYIENCSYSVTIDGGSGNDTIYNNYNIDGGYAYDDNDGSNVLFKYSAGDGKDKIYGFRADSTLSISGGSYSTTQSGEDVIVTVGKGKISLIGAMGLSYININGKKIVPETNTWKLKGTTAKYGTSKKTLVTVTGVKSLDGISLSDKVITLSASALKQNKVTVSKGYKLALDYDVNTNKETSTAWSYSNSTATYKQTNSAYYALSSDKKSVIYKAASNKTLATVKGVNSVDGLSVSGKKIIVSASALNKSKVTISGDGYKLALADDVTKSTSSKKVWSCKNSVATYNQTATAGYSLASDSKSISYSTGTNQTLATIKGVKSADGITVSDKIIKVLKNALGSSKKVTVKGNDYEFNFATGNISITGSNNADKITSNGSDVSIYGGAGNDAFSLGANAANNVIQYATGDGDDTVFNYSEDDTIRIESEVAKVSTSGNDVIFTVDNGSITVKDAKNKIISYSDANGDKTYSTVPATPYKISTDGKTVTIYTSYDKKDFDVTEKVTGGDKIETIDASAVNYGINIIGNEKSNKIIGGSGNDTLEGDNGNDTLVGGDGADVFLYYGGYGNDIISDYAESDTISIASGNISKVKPNGKDVIFTVGKNKITVKNALRKGITYIDKNDVEHDYKNGEQTVKINETKTTATISEDYWKKTFDVANFGKKIRIIDATPVTNDIKITGNDKANQILGGSGKNTLTGGAGNDTLQGNNKEDIFVYRKGDGDDIIYDYSEGDKISIVSGIVNNVSVKSDTVILTVGDGRISVYGAAGKTRITYRDENGEKTKIYSKETSNSNVAEPLWFAVNNFTEVNQLSALVQNNSADYSFLNTSTELSKETNLIAYSSKKITR